MCPRSVGGDTGDPFLDMALAELTEETGKANWSITRRRKHKEKFGRNDNLTNGVKATVWEVGEPFESKLTPSDGNMIDTISSSSASDTGKHIHVDGMAIDGSNDLYEVNQQVTLNGQAKVTLDTPLYRVNRMYEIFGEAALVGDIRIYQDTAISGGVPTDNTKVHNIIKGSAGEFQTFKLATTIPATEAWIVTGYEFSIQRNQAGAVDFSFESEPGNVELASYRPFQAPLTLSSTGNSALVSVLPIPHLILPNHDFRITATSNANGMVASGTVYGYLATYLP